MFKRHLWHAIQWICGTMLQIWRCLARPFRRRSDFTELPLASPVVPSTPSFIQSQEPNFNIDALRIFQLSNASQASHLARNKVAVQQMRTAPPNINRIASLSSTDPSPGFSLLTDVVDNLVTPVDSDLPSLYSSPPSSPSSSLHTPCIVVSGPVIDTTPHDDARLSFDFGLQRESRISKLASISQGELPLPRHISPDVYGLAKRRNFKGPPIITNISRDSLPFPPTCLSQGSVTPTDWRTPHNFSRPKSALAAVTDFVRTSTNIPPRSVSREAIVVSPESQAAYIQSSPFSAQAQSFFVDDHRSYPPEFNIHDLGIYADASSTLNLQVPRRKRTVAISEPSPTSFCMTTNNYGNPALAKSIINTTRVRTRTLSGVSHLSQTGNSSASIPDGPLSPTLVVPASVPSRTLDVQEGGSPGLSIRESGNERYIPPAVEVDEEWTVSSRLSLYSSLIFPFSLEDTISWDAGQDFQDHEIDFFDQNCNSVDHQEPVLGAVALNDNVVGDAIGVLKCDLQSPGITSTLPSSDPQCGNLPSHVDLVNTENDLVRDGNALPVFPKDRPVFFLSSVVDKSFVAGSTSLSISEIHTDSILDVRNSGPCEEEYDTACDLRKASLRQVGDVLDGSFVSPADSSVLVPVSESKSHVADSQTFSSTSMASIDRDTARSISAPNNTRRARPVAIYGPPFPSMITPDAQDTLLSNSEEKLDKSASERRRSPSQHGSRHGSALRPLVLPMRIAIHNSNNTGNRSFERTPDTLLQSNRTSIGFPPPFPLPELPLYESPSTSTIAASSFPRFEELDTYQNRQTMSTRSLTSQEPLSTYSAPKLDESYPISDSTHTVNWGVAF